MARVPAVLSIAGSDSGGGAGIQADLKAFAACGTHGMTALAALTAQNTVEVTGVHAVPPDFIVEQVRAVQADIGVDAVKIGMLGTAATVAAVNRALDLLDEAAREALTDLLIPRATVITPNVPEARVLVGEPDVKRLHALGPANVVLTGGHREEATDLFYDGVDITPIPGERHPDGAAHGSGCTHSSALAAHLAHGISPLEAARAAKRLASEAVRRGLREVGDGAGPVDALDVRARVPAEGVINSPG